MDANALREFAKQVADQTVLEHWYLWAILLLLVGVFTFVGTWLGAYAARRGQNLATKADFDELIEQTKLTTQEVGRFVVRYR